jgi:uncharacterized membrane protein YGL010W
MRKIEQLLSEYGESHQNQINKAIHWVCVPLIFFSVLGLIAAIPAGVLQRLAQGHALAHWATVVVALLFFYYLLLSVPLSIGMLLFSVACLYLVGVLAGTGYPLWAVSLFIFVAAWIGQFIGHKVEGKKPSFFKDLQFLLIGPAWLLHFIYRRLRIPY